MSKTKEDKLREAAVKYILDCEKRLHDLKNTQAIHRGPFYAYQLLARQIELGQALNTAADLDKQFPKGDK